jgi:tetratricopeptide (TPR) repeat protein/cellulose biosynthesis protein BcsQ
MFVTFYSYKGGVGRTVALVNVAFQLEQEGKKVVLLDFDLEAPGLHKYPFCKKKVNKGLLDYICDFVENESIPDIKQYLLFPEKGKYENITLFPAGACDEDYKKKLAQLDWNIIYEKYYGFDFIENMKSELVKACDTPDYVFIDSRTGLSDTGNICTLQIPDIVVLLFSLNNQNREGIEKVYKAIKGFKNPEKPDKIIDVIPVASPVPYGEAGMRAREIKKFSKIFKDNENIHILPYHPRLAFTETLILEKEMKEEDITNRISDLTKEIKRHNPMDTEKYKDEVNRLFQKGEFEKAIPLQQKVAEIKENDAEEWRFLGLLYYLMRKFEAALTPLDKAIEINPNDKDIINIKAVSLCNLDRFDEALPLYNKAIETYPNEPAYLNNKALALGNLKHFKEALSLLEKAIKIIPNFGASYYNKACILSMMGKKKESLECLKKAIELDPGYKEKAKTDPDLKSLHNLSAFKKLVGLE